MKKASKHIQPYPPEFRAEAIRLVRTSGKPRSEIARDLGLTSDTKFGSVVVVPQMEKVVCIHVGPDERL